MTAGRPTKYSEEVLRQAKVYLDGGWEAVNKFPMVEGLAQFLDLHKDTLYSWAGDEDKKEFSDVLSKIKQAQEVVLLEKGLTSEFNPTITKLVLTKHGYSDKQEQAITGANGTPLGVSITFHEPD